MLSRSARYDVAVYLESPEIMTASLYSCIQKSDGEAAVIAKALDDIARCKGMPQIAHESGLSSERVSKALSGDRSDDFVAILKIGRAHV